MLKISIDHDEKYIILEPPNASFRIEEWDCDSIKIVDSGLILSGYDERNKFHDASIGTFGDLVIRKEFK